MPNRRDVLGGGEHGVVYGTTKYAIKQINDKDAFNAEADAYCSLSKVESLCGRIPDFHGIDHRTGSLYLQRINEPVLRVKLPDESTLLQIKEHLLETISIIHEQGWVHGNIHLNNIFASGLLFDFSNAYKKSKLSVQVWEELQKKDRRDIRSCYLEALGIKKLEAATALLNSGVDNVSYQTELAELLHQSGTCSELLEKLEKITDPIPSLALEMCRMFRRGRRVRTGMRLLQELAPLVLCDDRSRRLHIQVQGELALCESDLTGEKACTTFEDVIQSSIALLGRTDRDTVRLQIKYTLFLENYRRYYDALGVLAALRVDFEDSLHPWTERVEHIEGRLRSKREQMEERLRRKRVKKRRRGPLVPAEQVLTQDDKENIPQGESHSLSKKQKLMQETRT